MAALGEGTTSPACRGDIHPKYEDLDSLGFEAQSRSSFQTALASILKSVQHPPPGPWGHGDVDWKMMLRTQRGSHKKTPVVHQCYVNTNRVHDFVAGMQGAKGGVSCKYVVIEKHVFKAASRVRVTAGLLFRR